MDAVLLQLFITQKFLFTLGKKMCPFIEYGLSLSVWVGVCICMYLTEANVVVVVIVVLFITSNRQLLKFCVSNNSNAKRKTKKKHHSYSSDRFIIYFLIIISFIYMNFCTGKILTYSLSFRNLARGFESGDKRNHT